MCVAVKCPFLLRSSTLQRGGRRRWAAAAATSVVFGGYTGVLSAHATAGKGKKGSQQHDAGGEKALMASEGVYDKNRKGNPDCNSRARGWGWWWKRKTVVSECQRNELSDVFDGKWLFKKQNFTRQALDRNSCINVTFAGRFSAMEELHTKKENRWMETEKMTAVLKIF